LLRVRLVRADLRALLARELFEVRRFPPVFRIGI